MIGKEYYNLFPKFITAKDLTNKQNRTLLYGYTLERNTWHVYLKDNAIYTVVYGYKEEPKECIVKDNFDYIPDKRVYPAKSDYEFCSLLIRQGINIPFTSFEKEEILKQYYGKILPDVKNQLYAIYKYPENGYSNEQEMSKKLLILNKKYEVKYISMGQSHTNVYLKDFPDCIFNSVQFIFIENNKPINIFKNPRYNPYL